MRAYRAKRAPRRRVKAKPHDSARPQVRDSGTPPTSLPVKRSEARPEANTYAVRTDQSFPSTQVEADGRGTDFTDGLGRRLYGGRDVPARDGQPASLRAIWPRRSVPAFWIMAASGTLGPNAGSARQDTANGDPSPFRDVPAPAADRRRGGRQSNRHDSCDTTIPSGTGQTPLRTMITQFICASIAEEVAGMVRG